MSRWYADNSLSIGRTPLIKLNRIADGARPASSPRSRDATPPIRSSVALVLR
jgi:hypothetical protein